MAWGGGGGIGSDPDRGGRHGGSGFGGRERDQDRDRGNGGRERNNKSLTQAQKDAIDRDLERAFRERPDIFGSDQRNGNGGSTSSGSTAPPSKRAAEDASMDAYNDLEKNGVSYADQVSSSLQEANRSIEEKSVLERLAELFGISEERFVNRDGVFETRYGLSVNPISLAGGVVAGPVAGLLTDAVLPESFDFRVPLTKIGQELPGTGWGSRGWNIPANEDFQSVSQGPVGRAGDQDDGFSGRLPNAPPPDSSQGPISGNVPNPQPTLPIPTPDGSGVVVGANNDVGSGGVGVDSNSAIGSIPPGVGYFMPVRNRDTGNYEYRPTTPYQNFMSRRRSGWGSSLIRR